MTGIIVLWSGAIVDIPSGWHLCDGTQGTPDLRDMFVIGAGDTYAPDDSDVGIPDSYVDRGDPAAYDFDHTDFAADNTWHDLDLSGIFPAGARVVHLHASLFARIINVRLYFREKGNVNNFNQSVIRTAVADIHHDNDLVCGCDQNRIIQGKRTPGGASTLHMIVRGWWVGTMAVPSDTVGYYALAYIMKL